MAAGIPVKRVFGVLLRLSVTALMLAYLFARIDLHEVAASFARLPLEAVLGGVAAYCGAITVGVLRWKVLLAAYGARRVPAYGELTRWYLISMFFNLLPGAVGGDVIRGYATRGYFENDSASSALGVVFVERVLGFGGLLILAATVATLHPIEGVDVVSYALLGLLVATLALLALGLGRRLGRFLPAALARLASTLPVLEQPRGFLAAVLLAVTTHVLVSTAGHVLIHALDASVQLGDSLVFFPVGSLAGYFPLTIGGAGTRDAALVALFAAVGVARADALACSLCLFALGAAAAMVGGLLYGARRTPASQPRGSGSRARDEEP